MDSTRIKTVALRPLKDNDKDYEEVERRIRKIWKDAIYQPIINVFGEKLVFKNAKSGLLEAIRSGLLEAIRSGQIEYYRGEFKGRLNATTSKDLKALGATWDRRTRTFKLTQSALPIEVRNAISASTSSFDQKLEKIDRLLAKILPEEIADKLKIENHFDKTLWRVEKDFHGSLRNLALAPKLTKETSERIADEWQTNLKLYIKDWTQKEIVKLRKDVQASVFAGNRRDAAVKIIKDSHNVSINKAKFLARQETRLLLTKYKQTRYEDAGVKEYKWGISNHGVQPKGAPYIKGMVRHDHGILDGRIFSWQNPPVTDSRTGARNNPGQDYNCRCFATPIVKFKLEEKSQ